jgi:hypothetical protein
LAAEGAALFRPTVIVPSLCAGEDQMNMAGYALLVSVASIFISIGALFWNVWQKFIFVRPALQVSFGLYRIVQPGIPAGVNHRLLSLTITNMGPGPVVLSSCVAKCKKPWWRRAQHYGLLNPIEGDPAEPNPKGIGPFGGGLPAKVDAGDVKTFYFPYSKEGFLKEGLARVGINDTYHRIFWCHRSDMQKVNQSYRREFIDGLVAVAADAHPTR